MDCRIFRTFGVYMFAKLKKFITDLVTENDNQTFCIARIGFVIALFSFIGLAVYHMYLSHTIVLTEYSSGIMQILSGGGVIIGAKNISGSK